MPSGQTQITTNKVESRFLKYRTPFKPYDLRKLTDYSSVQSRICGVFKMFSEDSKAVARHHGTTLSKIITWLRNALIQGEKLIFSEYK